MVPAALHVESRQVQPDPPHLPKQPVPEFIHHHGILPVQLSRGGHEAAQDGIDATWWQECDWHLAPAFTETEPTLGTPQCLVGPKLGAMNVGAGEDKRLLSGPQYAHLPSALLLLKILPNRPDGHDFPHGPEVTLAVNGAHLIPNPTPICPWNLWSPSYTILQLAKKAELRGTWEFLVEAWYRLSRRNMKGCSMVWPKRKARVKTLDTRGSTLE